MHDIWVKSVPLGQLAYRHPSRSLCFPDGNRTRCDAALMRTITRWQFYGCMFHITLLVITAMIALFLGQAIQPSSHAAATRPAATYQTT